MNFQCYPYLLVGELIIGAVGKDWKKLVVPASFLSKNGREINALVDVKNKKGGWGKHK